MLRGSLYGVNWVGCGCRANRPYRLLRTHAASAQGGFGPHGGLYRCALSAADLGTRGGLDGERDGTGQGFLAGERKSTELGAPYPGEPNLVVQLFGDDPEVLRDAAAKAEQLFRPVAIDLNMGCPAPKLAGQGGACLLQTPERAYALVQAMRQGTWLEVSAKIRLGWDENRSLEVSQGLEAAGVALITVHGRTSLQRYQGQADWEAIAKVAQSVRAPVLGCGDITRAEQFFERLQTGA